MGGGGSEAVKVVVVVKGGLSRGKLDRWDSWVGRKKAWAGRGGAVASSG